MANRSDRREDKPTTAWAMKTRPDDWLPARGFHFGQEGNSSFPTSPLHLQAGDTNAGLTHRLRRRALDQLGTIFIRGPTQKSVDIEEESRYAVVLPKATAPRPVEPLAPARYKIQFTASAELKDKIERLRALMPDSDLAVIIDEAVTEKLERLESRRFGKTRAPRKSLKQTDTSPSSRYIPAPVRRAVSERDGNQCAFVDARGKRCSERSQLQFHHKEPFARGGDHSPENIQLTCHAHNQYLAECEYGTEVMERHRGGADQAREPGPAYSSA